MKKIIIANLAFIALLGAVSCKKLDVVSDSKTLGVGSYLTLEKKTNLNIDYDNLNTTSVSIDVKEYGSPVDKITIYVSKEATQDQSAWKKIKTVPYSGTTTLNVKATEIATALGVAPSELLPGSQYTLYNEILTKDGRTYSFANTLADFEAISNYRMALRWKATVICAWTQASTNGTVWTIDEDGWEDFVAGDQFVMQNGPGANQVTMVGVYPTSYLHKDVVMDINPATGEVTIAKQAYGGYSNGGTVYSAEGSGYIFSCAGKLDLNVNHTGGGSNFGFFKFVAHQ
ncbi:MAG: hypothetical protein HYX40_06885 [Sphingobacteriales bacterium]|nr:hypothetical protein [Sphingobacteriales bacterium]